MLKNAGRILFGFAIGLAVIVTAGPAKADDLVLAPSTEWRYREFDDRCRASRVFGAEEDRTTLWIEQGGEESIYNLTLIGRPLRNPYGRGVRIQFGEDPEIIRSFIPATSSRGRPVMRMYGVTVIQPE